MVFLNIGSVVLCAFTLNNAVLNAEGGLARSERAVNQYTTKYDNIDINRIVTSRRLLLSYVRCLLDKGPCTPEGKELKTYLPEAMQTECAKCSQRQKEIAGTVLSHMATNYGDLWEELLKKYDPDGSFRAKYEGTDLEDEEEDEEED